MFVTLFACLDIRSGTEDPFNIFKSSIDGFINSKQIIPTSLSSISHQNSLHSSSSNKQASFVRYCRCNNTHRIIHLPFRPSLNDITSAISYSLYMEVTLHTIVSGPAFTALHRFIQLLERAFYTSHPDMSTLLRTLRIKMDTRRLAGFITSNDWIRVLDGKVSFCIFFYFLQQAFPSTLAQQFSSSSNSPMEGLYW